MSGLGSGERSTPIDAVFHDRVPEITPPLILAGRVRALVSLVGVSSTSVEGLLKKGRRSDFGDNRDGRGEFNPTWSSWDAGWNDR